MCVILLLDVDDDNDDHDRVDDDCWFYFITLFIRLPITHTHPIRIR